MTRIVKRPIEELGYHFIPEQFLPSGKDEYYLRNQQHAELFGGKKKFRHLSAKEIETLVQNNNTSDDWNNILVEASFDPDLVKDCHFFGLVRIGKLEPFYLEFHDFRTPVGIYNSTICSCDIGDNVSINKANYMSHYIIGNQAIIVNVNELSMSPTSKFGNGIIKEGEKEEARIWLELCNENGERKIIPFEGMLSADAFLWSKFREDHALINRFIKITQSRFDKKRGYYGVIGSGCIIKNSKTIKDTRIGDGAYIKGVNKLKNLTINSSEDAVTQIGEGCELVNGIVSKGCRIFYGVKAVRFVMSPYSKLNYGARLINSYLGSNATISCCEVLNSLIFPGHEQHHNNSFLCAALLMGQSNLAAGATIGSNHNSRGADGEIAAGRGFWPGLCVSLKHNSRFATYCLLSKGDYPFEINLPFPFTLLINDPSVNRLKVMPGYWFIYNMYALTRNAYKYPKRDKRPEKERWLSIEYDYLAPDSVEELCKALPILEEATGRSMLRQEGKNCADYTQQELLKIGKECLTGQPEKVARLEITLEGIENSKRLVELLKVDQGYRIYKDMIFYYGLKNIIEALGNKTVQSVNQLKKLAKQAKREEWTNVGGQLMARKDLEQLKADIIDKRLNTWQDIHLRYRELGRRYPKQKLEHALACLLEVQAISWQELDELTLRKWTEKAILISGWILDQIKTSRVKDYKNPFRASVYDSKEEMEAVIGKFSEDPFLNQAEESHTLFLNNAKQVTDRLEPVPQD